MIAPTFPPVILASASPRRRDLLATAGYRVEARTPEIDETPRAGEPPWELVVRLARAKCAAVEATPHVIVVAADTVVVLDEGILGKPSDDDHARRMLVALSARCHKVVTGWCVRRGDAERSGLIASEVTFRALSDAEIDAYVASGEPRDKAGAYAIQGQGGALVSNVRGSYTNVVGLPMEAVEKAIEDLKNR